MATSGPFSRITMSFVQAMPEPVRARLHPVTSRIVERWSPIRWYRNSRADAFILWFPKTGGTWVRMLMHTALCRHFEVGEAPPLEVELLNDIDPRIPRIRPMHDDAPHWRRPDQLRTHKERYRGRKVMLLVRDPRDAMVSLHLQVTKRWKVQPEVTLSDFIWQERGAFRSMIRFYNIWAANRHVPGELLLVRYEDVHADPQGMLRRMLEFSGVPDVSDEVIAEAVAFNRFDKVREREKAGAYDTRRLRPGTQGDPESFKVRKGKVGGFVEYLKPEDVERMTRIIREELDPWYGYPVPVAQADERPSP